jgi:hypothetical protein
MPALTSKIAPVWSGDPEKPAARPAQTETASEMPEAAATSKAAYRTRHNRIMRVETAA